MNAQPTTSTGSKELRIEVLATRVTPAEMAAVEAAAASSGATRSEWLRACALAYLQRPHQGPEVLLESTILEETMGIRYLLLNLFARVNPGLGLDALHDVMAIADAGKQGAASRVLTRSGENPTPWRLRAPSIE